MFASSAAPDWEGDLSENKRAMMNTANNKQLVQWQNAVQTPKKRAEKQRENNADYLNYSVRHGDTARGWVNNKLPISNNQWVIDMANITEKNKLMVTPDRH